MVLASNVVLVVLEHELALEHELVLEQLPPGTRRLPFTTTPAGRIFAPAFPHDLAPA